MTSNDSTDISKEDAVNVTKTVLDDRYELLGVAGQGAMGIVYRGRDRRLHRDVALKCISSGHLKQAHEQAIREARTLASLHHPGLVHIYDVLTTDGQIWIITEWLQGKSLAQLKVPLAPLVTLSVAIQIFEALSAAHAANIFHRDIKPSNIMLCGNGRVTLIDFGVAFSPGVSSGETIAGSLRYTDPRILEGKAADALTDLFSVALVLLELMSGETVLPDLAPLPLFRYLKDDIDPRIDSMCDGHFPPIVTLVKSYIARARSETKQEVASALQASESLQRELSLYTPLSPMRFLAESFCASIETTSDVLDRLQTRTRNATTDTNIGNKERACWISFQERLLADEHIASRTSQKTSAGAKPRFHVVPIFSFIGILFTLGVAYGIWVRNGDSHNAQTNSTAEPTAAANVSVPVPELTAIAGALTTPIAAPTAAPVTSPAPTSLAAEPTSPPKAVTKTRIKLTHPKAPTSVKPKNEEHATLHLPKHVWTDVLFVANAWAEVIVDGRPEGRLPRAQPIKMRPGKHRIQLESPLVTNIDRVVEIPDEGTHRLVFKLMPKIVNQLIMLERDAHVFIDGKDQGVMTSRWMKLSYGSHEVRIRRQGEAERLKIIEIGPDSPSQIFVE